MTTTKHRLYSGATPAQVADDLAPLVDFQRRGMPLDELQTLLDQRLLPHLMRYDSPSFQSMFNAFPSEAAQLGAILALAVNQGVTNWQVSPGGAILEELCGRALCDLFGLAPSSDATFLYSGTYANQEALYLALHRHAERCGFNLAEQGVADFEHPERLAVLISEDAHFSVKHAVRMLGLGERSIVRLPLDSQRRIDVAKAEAIVAGLEGSADRLRDRHGRHHIDGRCRSHRSAGRSVRADRRMAACRRRVRLRLPACARVLGPLQRPRARRLHHLGSP